MKLSSLTPVAAVLAVSLTAVAHAQTNANPFMAQPLSTIVVAAGEGSCGGAKKNAAKEGSCGGAKKNAAKEGSCGADSMRADANKDGKVSKEEFISHHEAMFNAADANKDGVLDAVEHQTLHSTMKGASKAKKEGKCGEGKCGANKNK